MPTSIPLIIALACTFARAQEFTIPKDLQAGALMPQWRGGLVLRSDGAQVSDTFRTFDSGGKERRFDLRLPEVKRLVVHDVAMRGGLTAMVGVAIRESGEKAAGLFLFDEFGRLSVFRRTNPFRPRLITIRPDGLIWVFGHNTAERFEDVFVDHPTIRVFDSAGKEHGAYAPISKLDIPGKLTAAELSGRGEACLLSSNSRVGLWVPRNGIWLEFNLQGEVVGKWKLPEPWPDSKVTGCALTDSGRLFIFAHQAGDWGHFELDRINSVWVRRDELRPLGVLYGAEGEKLLLAAEALPGTKRFVWTVPPRN